jgi:hypothetical protein
MKIDQWNQALAHLAHDAKDKTFKINVGLSNGIALDGCAHTHCSSREIVQLMPELGEETFHVGVQDIVWVQLSRE